jgi:hypothetical protein
MPIPRATAKADVTRYRSIIRIPTLPRVAGLTEDEPTIKVDKISGTIIIIRSLIKRVPKG